LSPSFSPGAAYVELPESILDVDGDAALSPRIPHGSRERRPLEPPLPGIERCSPECHASWSMLDERQRRLARNLAIALVLAGCSAAQYAAVSKAATCRVPLAADGIHPTAAGSELMGRQVPGLIVGQRGNVSRASNR
jgi:hypothetical protein